MCRVGIQLAGENESPEMREYEMFIGAFYTVASPRRRRGKSTQTVLQECAAIFRLFTADAVSQAGSHTNTVPLSSDLVSGTAEVKGDRTGLA